jgi:hypothetical protein
MTRNITSYFHPEGAAGGGRGKTEAAQQLQTDFKKQT